MPTVNTVLRPLETANLGFTLRAWWRTREDFLRERRQTGN
jgi:hypothetical protein